MLRWGTLLLAALLSFTYITETQVLVEIRSGEYMAGHGILPPRVDPFSTSAAERAWVNLGWLSNLLLGIVHNAGLGAVTLFGVVTTILAFLFLNKTNTSGVTTWWGSICLGIAAIAVFPQLQPGTMSTTVLGLAVLLWLIQRWRENPGSNANWHLPLLFLIWGNMDPHAFLGLLVLLAFGLGTLLTGAPERKVTAESSGIRGLWMQTGLSLVALLVHPWHWHTLESGWVQLQVIPAEIRAYNYISEFLPDAGLTYVQREYWQNIDAFELSAIVLAVLAFVLQVLNISRFDGGLCLAWIAIVACGGMNNAVFTYSAIVSAVVAAISGQEWYRANFSMAYTVKTLPMLYSRLGRAVTVLGGFAIAYLAVNGSLMGPAGRRLGLGLDPRWEKRIGSLEKTLADGGFDVRTFPFRPDQGDLMLWLGNKPFIDGRLSLFASGGENLLQYHRDLRQAIVGVDTRTARGLEPLQPFAELDKFQITNAVTRLWTPNPPYEVFVGLINRPDDWVLTGLGASGAIFTRANTGREDVNEFIKTHNAMQFVEQAFRSKAESVTSSQFDIPQTAGAYDRWLYQPLPEVNADVEVGMHYLRLAAEAARAGNPQLTTALAVLASRHTRRGLIKNPNQVEGWRVLGQAQTVFLATEIQLLQQIPPDMQMRSMSSLAASANAVRTGKDNPADLHQLAARFLESNRLDAGLVAMLRLEHALGGKLTTLPASDPSAEPSEQQQREQLDQLKEVVEKTQTAVNTALQEKKELLDVVPLAIQAGCPMVALSVLESDLTSVTSNLSASFLYAGLMMEAARMDDAWKYLEGMQRMLPQPPIAADAAGVMQEWYQQTALANYAVGNLDRAEELIRTSIELKNRINLAGIVQQPFGVTMVPTEHAAWPMIMTSMMATGAADYPEFWASLQYQLAMIKIDTGNVQEATRLLSELLDVHPEWSRRILAVYYLTLLTGEEIPIQAPSDQIPVTPDIFAPDEPMEPTATESAPSTPETSEKPAPAANESAEGAPPATSPPTTDPPASIESPPPAEKEGSEPEGDTKQQD